MDYRGLRNGLLQGRDNGQYYNRTWKTSLMGACCAEPCYCFLGIFCCHFQACQLRKRALYNDSSRFTCCQGTFPCSGKMGEKSCPEFCMLVEACMCFPTSMVITRGILQDEMLIQNTKCDNCLIGTAVCLQYLSCVCTCAAMIAQSEELAATAQLVDCLADMVWCSVCACMLAQHKHQMDERDRNPNIVINPNGFYNNLAQNGVMVAPPRPQQMASGYQNQPPPVQYAPQPQGYGPPPGYPQQPPMAYAGPPQPMGGYYQQAPPGYGPPGYPPQHMPPQGYGPPPPGYPGYAQPQYGAPTGPKY